MKKTYSRLFTLLFCLFIGGVAVLSLCLPDRDFSPEENRTLQQAPAFSLSSVMDGTFMSKMESYISDQILWRDGWVHLKAAGERLLGKKENNDIFFCGDTLVARVAEPSPERMEKNMEYLDALCENVEVPVHFGLIPSAATVWADKLPTGADTADETAWIRELYGRTNAQTIDFASALSAHREEDVFYRTDHHWTSLGACYGAGALADALGLPGKTPDAYEKTTVTTDFYGTNYSASGAFWVSPDAIETFVSGDNVAVETHFTSQGETGTLYVPEKLEIKDKYSFFLGGNQPLCVIRTETEGERVLLIRDSYSDSLSPFLTELFSEIHMVDLRYFRESIQNYVRDNRIDRVIVLYGFSTYAEDTNQFLLTQ